MTTDSIQILQQLNGMGAGALLVVALWIGYLIVKVVSKKKNGVDVKDERQDICLAEIKKDIEYIKLQVSNHLPTAIKSVTDKLDKHIENQIEFEKQVIEKLAKLK